MQCATCTGRGGGRRHQGRSRQIGSSQVQAVGRCCGDAQRSPGAQATRGLCINQRSWIVRRRKGNVGLGYRDRQAPHRKMTLNFTSKTMGAAEKS